jgi:hypothetical protein
MRADTTSESVLQTNVLGLQGIEAAITQERRVGEYMVQMPEIMLLRLDEVPPKFRPSAQRK